MGAASCCSDPAFPFVSPAFAERIATAGANWATIRCGPLWKYGWVGNDYISGDATYRQYVTAPDGRADLGQFNEAYFVKVRTLLQRLYELRLYVEIDLVDAWTMERPEAHPWSRENNVQGFDGGDCSILQHVPHGYAIAFVHRLIHETGMFSNVLYQIGNETFDCRGVLSKDWEIGIVAAVRNQEVWDKYDRHLIGSNAYPTLPNQPWADYESWHQNSFPPAGPRPRQVNEYGKDLSPEQWGIQARIGLAKGGAFHLWVGDLDEAGIDATLREMMTIREER
jgi:hypothetical protein